MYTLYSNWSSWTLCMCILHYTQYYSIYSKIYGSLGATLVCHIGMQAAAVKTTCNKNCHISFCHKFLSHAPCCFEHCFQLCHHCYGQVLYPWPESPTLGPSPFPLCLLWILLIILGQNSLPVQHPYIL